MSELNIPQHWAEINLGTVINFKTGYAFKSSEFRDKGIFVVRVTNIDPKNSRIEKSDNRFISESLFHSKYQNFALNENDILIVMVGASTGKIGLVDKDILPAVLNQNMWNLKPSENLNKLYFFNYLKFLEKDVLSEAAGSATGFITQSDFKQKMIPLPPKREQERIVKKIESYFQKIDETEKALNDVELLLTKYRESLLAKAFRGELIPQDPKDEPASKLLEKIRAERVKNSNGKKVQEFAPISEDEKPFDLPEGLEWISIGEAFYLGILEEHKDGNHGGSYPRSNEFISNGTPYITAKCIDDNECLDSSKYEYLSPERARKLTIGHLKKGDILFAHNATVGPAVLYQEDFEDAVIGTSLTCYRPNPKFLSPHFLLFYLRSDLFQNQVKKVMKQATRNQVPILKQREFFIPYATLKCQDLIEQEIRSCLISFSQELATVEKSLNAIPLLKESILSKAFQGSLVPQIDAEGTGQELLEKILETKALLHSESEMKVSKKLTKKTSIKKARK